MHVTIVQTIPFFAKNTFEVRLRDRGRMYVALHK